MTENQTDILNQVYRLILDPNTLKGERLALLSFKRLVAIGQDFDSELRRFVKRVDCLQQDKALSNGVAQLYQRLSLNQA